MILEHSVRYELEIDVLSILTTFAKIILPRDSSELEKLRGRLKKSTQRITCAYMAFL